MLKPYLIKQKGSKKQVLKEHVFSNDAVKTVNDAMKQVISNPNGTGHAAQIDGIDLKGKTGTAEIKQSQTDTKGTELGWFVTIMPKTDLSIMVIIRKPMQNSNELVVKKL